MLKIKYAQMLKIKHNFDILELILRHNIGKIATSKLAKVKNQFSKKVCCCQSEDYGFAEKIEYSKNCIKRSLRTCNLSSLLTLFKSAVRYFCKIPVYRYFLLW